jgi:N-methylhydantoinase B
MIDNKIGLEILSNRFQAIVDEMAQALFRTAHTVFVKETQDYGAALVSRRGEVFAAPRRYGCLFIFSSPPAWPSPPPPAPLRRADDDRHAHG